MKTSKILLLMLGGALLATSCNDLNEQDIKANGISQAEMEKVLAAVPSRIDASFSGMISYLGRGGTSGLRSNGRPDDFGAPSWALSLDMEGADMAMGDNNYNWFSVADQLLSRNANYANPYERYIIPYIQCGVAQTIIKSYPEGTTDENALQHIAEAKAIEAYDYMCLAPYFQFGYSSAQDKPCIPIIKEGVDATNNPRATVKEVYEVILQDLDYAVEHLKGYTRPNKQYIDLNVAYGLRARANLLMGNYAAAAEDAKKAMEGYTPATRDEVKEPGFDDINSHNWMWGIIKTDADMQDNDGNGQYQNPSAWFSGFSGDGYSAATGNTPVINKLLWDKIPATDIRKGWWLDGKKHSDNWANISWDYTDGDTKKSAKGDAIADLVIKDVKLAFEPYTNIKFGQKSGIGSTVNTNDFPLMRVEEMILIEAEGLAKSGHEAEAKQVLENFVKTYRDPDYKVDGRGLSLADEIWFQRRVELWGEGFYTADAKRLGKPIVRFHQGVENNFPSAFQFNIAADDGWLNMRFPQTEMDNNKGIVDNQGGSLPVAGQNGNLRDGVTD